MGKMKKLILILLFPVLVYAQPAKQDSTWNPMKFFIGEWTGKGGGEPGYGDYASTYRFIFGSTFIEIKTRSTYPATDKKPQGEVHDDVGYMSYDRGRKTFVLRQFHAEGFVNMYVLDSLSSDNKTIVFITEQIENIPAGWKARETYQIHSDNEFVETFELAEPGKGFFVYTKTIYHRK